VDLKSCTYENWKAGQDCMLQFTIPTFGIVLQAAIGHCPNSAFPYMSLTCSGAACDSIGYPCNTDSDCSSPQKCWTLTTTNTSAMFQAFVQGYLYDDIDVSPGCYPANTLFTGLFDWIRTTVYQTSAGYKFSMLPSLDFRMCFPNVVNTTLPFNCSSTTNAQNITVYSCTNLANWNGVLADGSSVNSASRLSGSVGTLTFDPVPTGSNNIPFGYHSSDNSISFLPNGASGLISGFLSTYTTFIDQFRSGNYSTALEIVDYALLGTAAFTTNAQGKFPLMNKAADLWFPMNYNWQSCRATNRGRQLSEDEYKTRFGFYLQYGLSLLTNPHQTFYNTMTDWYVTLLQNSNLGTFVPPDTCSYNHYNQTSSCSMQFTGLQSLLNSDLTFNILIQDCPGWHVPAMYMECAGKDCDLITQPQLCSSDADCTQFPGTKCFSFSNSLNYDFIQAYFTHVWTASETCASSSVLLTDIQNLISHYTKTQTTQNSVCFLDLNTLINTVDISAWANSEYIVTGETYVIKDLSSWTPPPGFQIPGTVADQSSNGISLVYSWLLLLLILITWWM